MGRAHRGRRVGTPQPAGAGHGGTADRLPDPVLDELAASGFGTPVRLERLEGLSGATVHRVRFARQSLIVKVAAKPNEPEFYRTVAPALRARGIGIPELVGAGRLRDRYWLALEHVPEPLPPARWIADDEQMETLRRLHGSTLELPALDGAWFGPEWTTAMTESALAWLTATARGKLRGLLRPIRHAALSLFRPDCSVSGDPNPGNWGLRDDGSLVLFDWERFGRAAPALDVAITIPGLPDRETLTTIAAAYLGDGDRAAVDALTRELAAAKVWTAIEFLDAARRRGTGPDDTARRICSELERWVGQMARVVA